MNDVLQVNTHSRIAIFNPDVREPYRRELDNLNIEINTRFSEHIMVEFYNSW